MPKSTVTSTSSDWKAPGITDMLDAKFASPSQGADKGLGELSYLQGSNGSGDRSNPWDMSYSEHVGMERFQRHMSEQGSSTFVAIKAGKER